MVFFWLSNVFGAVCRPAVDKCLVESLKNPRSSVIRESLQLAQDLLSCGSLKGFIKEQFVWAKLVPAMLLKAINDKKFLADQGKLVQPSPLPSHSWRHAPCR